MGISMIPTTEKSFALEVAKGDIPGHASIHKFGLNPAIATPTEDIWDGGGSFTYLDAASSLQITSSDANDTVGGTGANTVLIFGLDSSYNEISEVVSMNGTGNTVLANNYLRVYRLKVISVGSNGVNIGALTLSTVSGGIVQGSVLADKGQSLMCLYTVPAGKTAYMVNYFASIANKVAAAVSIEILFREIGLSWNIKETTAINSQGTSHLISPFIVPLKIPEKTDIRIRASDASATVPVAAGFDLVLVDN